MEGCDLVYGDWYGHNIFIKRSNMGLWGLVGRGMGTSGARDGGLRGGDYGVTLDGLSVD